MRVPDWGRLWHARARTTARAAGSRLNDGGLQGPGGRLKRFGDELLGKKRNRCAVHGR